MKKCQQRRTVIFADEFRSSMLDSVKHTIMHHPPQKEAVSRSGRIYLKRVYGLYQSSASGYSRLWNRDCNAARNILLNYRHVLLHGEFPVEFRRETRDLAVPKACRYKYKPKPPPDLAFKRWL